MQRKVKQRVSGEKVVPGDDDDDDVEVARRHTDAELETRRAVPAFWSAANDNDV